MESERDGGESTKCQLDDLDQVILDCESEATGIKIDNLSKGVCSVVEVEEEEEDAITVKYLPISIMSIEEKITTNVPMDGQSHKACADGQSASKQAATTNTNNLVSFSYEYGVRLYF